jgi:NADH-quinone oxidoreductase subunit C/D
MIAETTIRNELQDKFGAEAFTMQETPDRIPTLWITRESLHEVVYFLKREVAQPYKLLYDLTAIDERARAHREGQPTSDFTVVYHLLSLNRNE